MGFILSLLTSIAALFGGDYDGGLANVGIDEDHPAVGLVLGSSR